MFDCVYWFVLIKYFIRYKGNIFFCLNKICYYYLLDIYLFFVQDIYVLFYFFYYLVFYVFWSKEFKSFLELEILKINNVLEMV